MNNIQEAHLNFGRNTHTIPVNIQALDLSYYLGGLLDYRTIRSENWTHFKKSASDSENEPHQLIACSRNILKVFSISTESGEITLQATKKLIEHFPRVTSEAISDS